MEKWATQICFRFAATITETQRTQLDHSQTATPKHHFWYAAATEENGWNRLDSRKTSFITKTRYWVSDMTQSSWSNRFQQFANMVAHSQRCHYRVVPCVWDEFRMFDVRLHNSKRCPPLRSRPEVAFWNLDAVSASVQDSENFIKKQRRRLCIDILNILKLRGRISIDQQYLAMIEMWIILLIAHP